MKKRTWKLRYKPFRGAEYCARLVEAETLSEAREALGSYWSIGLVSLLCDGTTKAGLPCSRFSAEDYCKDHRA